MHLIFFFFFFFFIDFLLEVIIFFLLTSSLADMTFGGLEGRERERTRTLYFTTINLGSVKNLSNK